MQIDVIHRLVAAYPDDLYLAKSAAGKNTNTYLQQHYQNSRGIVLWKLHECWINLCMIILSDIETAIENKKIASLIAVEGGHSIQSSFAILRLLYAMGVWHT